MIGGEPRARSRVPALWAHRGASAHAPENTEAAFARAIADGADGVELDVRDAACGTVVVAHDPTLDRVARRPGVVADLTAAALSDIRVMDAGCPNGVPGFPTLDEAIDQVVGAGLRLNVEIKGDVPNRIRLAKRVASLLARRAPRERDAILISSFRPEILVATRAFGARVPVAFLFDAEHTGELRAAALWRVVRPDGLHPQHRLATRSAIARWKRRGLFVNAWTVEDEDRLRTLARDGIDGIITNDPARARRALAAGP
ncbi:MAG: glycerophosphodiester phosphodiesterase [Sandaracinaceae bacterium]